MSLAVWRVFAVSGISHRLWQGGHLFDSSGFTSSHPEPMLSLLDILWSGLLLKVVLLLYVRPSEFMGHWREWFLGLLTLEHFLPVPCAVCYPRSLHPRVEGINILGWPPSFPSSGDITSIFLWSSRGQGRHGQSAYFSRVTWFLSSTACRSGRSDSSGTSVEFLKRREVLFC